MYPGVIAWLRRRAAAECCVSGDLQFQCSPADDAGECSRPGFRGRGWGEDGGKFGVRRPLRFLAFKLELDEKQVAELAKILDRLKIERAQAAVDQRRTLSGFAEAVSGESFDETKAGEAAGLRLESERRLKDEVVTALSRIHALLDVEQRGRLAYLIRTGVLLF